MTITGSLFPVGVRPQSEQRKQQSFPTLDEVRAVIPANGIEIKELVRIFKPVARNKQDEFIALIKQAATQNRHTKRIMLIPEAQFNERNPQNRLAISVPPIGFRPRDRQLKQQSFQTLAKVRAVIPAMEIDLKELRRFSMARVSYRNQRFLG